MESIIKKIYEAPCLRETFSKKNPEYVKKHTEVLKQLEIWKTKLSSEDYNNLEKLLDMQIEAESLQSLEDFGYGFKLGIMISVELLK